MQTYPALNLVAGIAMLFGLQACSTTTPHAALNTNPNFAPVYAKPEERKVATGAIYKGRVSDNWFGRGRTYQVGDVITVLLNEYAAGGKTQKADLSRDSKNDVIPTGIKNLPGGVFKGLKLDGGTITSTGGNTTNQEATLEADVSVTVVEVYSNGNLLVRGEKQLALTEGVEVIQVSGIIRPEDVSSSNTVQSRRLANAQISYRGTGDLANATRPGWGTSLLFKLWPF